MTWYSLENYNYKLPEPLIAKTPVRPRDKARLLSCDPSTSSLHHHMINELPKLLPKESVLVINDTRVQPARMYLQTDKRSHEFLLVNQQIRDNQVQALIGLIKNRKKLKIGQHLSLTSTCSFQYDGASDENDALAVLTPLSDLTSSAWQAMMEKSGQLPIPPYLNRPYDAEHDPHDYQTVYASKGFSVAAPTAGLHFTHKLLDHLQENQIHIVPLTLDVGYGTFQLIQEPDIRQHQIHRERYQVSQKSWETIGSAKQIIAVGTTCLRALESFAKLKTPVFDQALETKLFVYPGFDFQVVTHLLTNFHLPKSSLLSLIYAFGGIDFMKQAYQEAVKERYRFYSYGDAMLVTRQEKSKS